MSLNDNRRSDLLRRAFQNGDIGQDNQVNIDLYRSVIDFVSRNHPPNKNRALTERWQDPRTIRIVEHGYVPYTQPDNLASVDVEVGRISVPWGFYCVVKRIDTLIYSTSTDPPTYPTQPYTGNPDIDNISWHLRLTNYNGRQDPRVIVTPIGPSLPGWPHPDLPTINGYWYGPQAACNSDGLTVVIPQSHELRLYCRIPSTSNLRLSVAARIRGYRQRTDSNPAAINSHVGTPVS